MYCPACGHQHSEIRSRCSQCLSPLPLPCSSCQQITSPGASYCCHCGHPVNATEAPAPSSAERRQLTVMFCDLVGSTALSQQLDPEEFRELIHQFQQRCAEVITRFDGYIARYMGDGLLVYFGYPSARERDAECSIHAGLALLDASQRLSQELAHPVQIRIGIETGLVVAGDVIGSGESQEHSVLGDTPNLAARLQAMAPPGALVIGPGTYRLVGNQISVDNLGSHHLKGFSAPIAIYRVLSATTPRPSGQRPPLVGRKQELQRLCDWLNDASGTAPVIIEGASGLGKTRLLEEMLERSPHHFERVILRCSPFYRDRPFYPVIRHWKTVLRAWRPQASNATAPLLLRYLESHQLVITPEIELLANALLPSAASPDNELTAEARGAMLQALIDISNAFSRLRPMLLVIEDAHWIDSSTASLLAQLCEPEAAPGLRLCITTREPLNWVAAEDDRIKVIQLSALNPDASERLLREISANQPLPHSIRQAILERCEGSPLYLEELTKSVLEQPDGEELTVPTSLQDSLRGRIDRLGPTKALAQFIAVIGRHFSERLVLACSLWAAEETRHGLERLLESQLLVRSGEGQHAVYAFKHMMVQEIAYSSILHKIRREHHRHIANAIEAHFPELAQTSPELLAIHLERSEQLDRAWRLWRKAGHQASRSWAHVEAVNHYQRALGLMERDDNPANGRDELYLRLDLVRSLRVLDRADEGLLQLDRVRTIAQQLKLDQDLAVIHNLTGNLRFSIGDVSGCHQSHLAAIASARQAGQIEQEIQALSGVGDANLLCGHAITAERAFDDCLRLCRSQEHARSVPANLSLRGHVRLYLNRVSDSEADIRESIRLAQQAGNKRAEMVARGSCLAKTLCERAAYDDALSELDQALTLAREFGAARFESLYLLFMVRASRHRGQSSELQKLARQAIDIAAESQFHYIGAAAFGAKALVEPTPALRLQALEEGEALLSPQTASQNFLWFLRDAIEICLRDGSPAQLTHFADLLRHYTRQQPLPWANLYIAIAESATALEQTRAIARHAKALSQLAEQARGNQLLAAAVLIDERLRTLGARPSQPAAGESY